MLGKIHLMNRFIKYIASGLVTLFLAVFLRAAPPAAQPLANEESILYASEVYLLQSREVAGETHFYIEAVWRHDPKVGAAPAVGSEFDGPIIKESEIIVFIFNPRLHSRISRQGVPVVNGSVPRFQMSVDDLRAIVQSTAWAPSPSN